MSRPHENPFATRKIQPNLGNFLFLEGPDDLESLGCRLRESGEGEIVGPHGTGKSTLAASLADAFRNAGGRVQTIQLQRAQWSLGSQIDRSLSPGSLLIVDGAERLSWWGRRRLRAWSRRNEVHLLVTAHRSLGMPTLYITRPTLPLFRAVADRLLEGDYSVIDREDIDACFARHRLATDSGFAGSDIREALFSLYDLFEDRVRASRTPDVN